MSGVLLLSRSPVLVAELQRLCAITGKPLEVRAEPAGGLTTFWTSASVVVVDADAADLVEAADLPRRDATVVLAGRGDDLAAWQLAARVGSSCVLVLPADAQPLFEQIVTATDSAGPPGTVIGVSPAAGGAGASTLAAALALRAAQSGAAVTLVDLDPAAGGLDVLLGAEHQPGLRWSDLRAVRGAVAADVLREALVQVGGLRLLSGSRQDTDGVAVEAVSALMPALRRGQDLVVVDLPRRFDPAAELAAAACDRRLLVVTAEVRAVAAAATLCAGVLMADAQLVVRTTEPRRLRPADLGTALSAAPIVDFPTEPAVAAATDRGELAQVLPRSRLAAAADTLLGQLAAAPRAA
ncbi:MAG TPA: septum site-determining protein Ssd [Mycobacteriales bacterium]|nr:septum site-determining protein Ssd [Mycobacteriales bacterium]